MNYLKITINIFLCLISMSAYSSELKVTKYKYNQKKSISFNEGQFLKNIKQDCKNYGYQREKKQDSPNEVLQTYPKELAFLYFKKHINKICYYGVSTLVKYLYRDFKKQTEKLLVGVVSDCIRSRKDYHICKSIGKQSVLFDLTILLGNFCSTKSLKAFKNVNCHYKQVADRSCSLYKNLNKPLESCPFYYSNQTEIKELHKSYYGPHCSGLRRWVAPRCIN